MLRLFGLSLCLALVLAALAELVQGQCQRYSDGCSTPGGIWLPYKVTFTPSCQRHDACYHCGAKFGISRAQCDQAFLSDMKEACDATGGWGKRRALRKKRGICTWAAQEYYNAVNVFGIGLYKTEERTQSFCGEEWVRGCLP